MTAAPPPTVMFELWDIENDESAGGAWFAYRADAERQRATYDHPEVIEVRPVREQEPSCHVDAETPGAAEEATPTNIDLARKMLGQLPDGTKFYASSWWTTASGRNDWAGAEERRRRVVDELKEASVDERVRRISIIIVYDE